VLLNHHENRKDKHLPLFSPIGPFAFYYDMPTAYIAGWHCCGLKTDSGLKTDTKVSVYIVQVSLQNHSVK
jgi:hypothetical protein